MVVQKILLIICLGLLVVIGLNKYENFAAHKLWKRSSYMEQAGLRKQAIEQSRIIYPALNKDGKFLFFFGGMLFKEGKYTEAYNILTETKNHFSDPNLNILLAQAAFKLKMTKTAEKYLIQAQNMTPAKFYPRYLLVKLYNNEGETNKARIMAEKIIKMDIKVNSPAVQQMIEEMQVFLNRVKKY